jgi:hypothetical protein
MLCDHSLRYIDGCLFTLSSDNPTILSGSIEPDGFVDCAGKPERISRNRIELRRLLQEPIILRRIAATF